MESYLRSSAPHLAHDAAGAPTVALGKAYTSGVWPSLVRLLGDPAGHEQGREQLCAVSPLGGRTTAAAGRSGKTRVAALFYSLIESARLRGVEPRAYLSEAARRAIRDPGMVTLPRDLK